MPESALGLIEGASPCPPFKTPSSTKLRGCGWIWSSTCGISLRSTRLGKSHHSARAPRCAPGTILRRARRAFRRVPWLAGACVGCGGVCTARDAGAPHGFPTAIQRTISPTTLSFLLYTLYCSILYTLYFMLQYTYSKLLFPLRFAIMFLCACRLPSFAPGDPPSQRI